DDSYRELQLKGLPIIAIDREMNPEFFCSVVSDDHDASLQLTHSLLETNPRHIALLGARPELSISRARAAGFEHALNGFAGTTIVEHGEAFSRQCGQRLMTELLQRLGHFPDALITTSYVLLQGVFDVLQSQTLNSTSLHLGTFGDTQLLDFLPLPVNAMAQQHQKIAETALQLALAAIQKNEYQPGVHAIVRTFKQRIHKE
ncbi:substrate-binding domain-containing protein, partial [Pseudomonas viridiflava]